MNCKLYYNDIPVTFPTLRADTGKECEPVLIDVNWSNCYSDINKLIQKEARYEFSYKTTPEGEPDSATTAHVVLITRDKNNELLIYDAQTGEAYYGEQEIKLYLNSAINTYNTRYDPRILRVDDKIPNPKYTDWVVKKH